MSYKFRASYSTLSTWARGDIDRAVEGYFKLATFTTPQMEAGKKFHKEWELEIKETGCMPKVFGGKQIKLPHKTERKIVRQITDWMELVGVIDLDINSKLLIDFKTGKTPSGAYTQSFQHKLYQILRPTAHRFEYHHYDQYKKTSDVSIIYLTDQTMDEGLNYLLTYGAEMHSYLIENRLYERYSK
jgi:hypothetical protein